MFLLRGSVLRQGSLSVSSLFLRRFSTTRQFWKQLDLKDISPSKSPSKPQIKHENPQVEVDPVSKYDKIIQKLPNRLQKYGYRLIDAPLPHVVSFLTLHELSAVIPFLGLWYFFHNYGFLPTDIPSWIILKGTGFIEKILGDSVADLSIQERTKLIIEGATAYGVVKAMFIPRVLGSLFLTPWFASVIIEPIFGVFNRITGSYQKKREQKLNTKVQQQSKQPIEKK